MKTSQIAANLFAAISAPGFLGVTASPTTGLDAGLETGYGVSLSGAELRLPVGALTEPVLKAVLKAWIDTVALPKLLADPGALGGFRDHETGGGYSLNVREDLYLGAWVDEGFLYLDVTEHVKADFDSTDGLPGGRKRAENLARMRCQKAFWSFAAKMSLYV